MLRSLASSIVVVTVFQLLACRALTPRIVGGQEAMLGQIPMIAHFYNQQNGHQHCGGTIVNSNYILSAAHCFAKCGNIRQCATTYAVLVGDVSVFHTQNSPRSRQLRYITNIINHEQYNTSSHLIHDITLIYMCNPIAFSKDVAPAVLSNTKPRVNEECVVAGMGHIDPTIDILSDVEKVLFVRIADHQTCDSTFGDVFKDTMLCTESVEDKTGHCFGDSGGPLICNGNVLVGIVSYTQGCKTGGYTDVSAYRQWISEKFNRVKARSGCKRLSLTFTTFKLVLFPLSYNLRNF